MAPSLLQDPWGKWGKRRRRSSVSRRSVVINGHKTSVSLEAAFWNELKEIAHGRRVPPSKLVTKIDGSANISTCPRRSAYLC